MSTNIYLIFKIINVKIVHIRKGLMKIKICESHIKIYEYLKRKVDKTKDNRINIKYEKIKSALNLSYPIVAKCMTELVAHGCIKKVEDGKGRKMGSTYLVDTRYKVYKKKVAKEKVYKTKYTVTVLELKKEGKYG